MRGAMHNYLSLQVKSWTNSLGRSLSKGRYEISRFMSLRIGILAFLIFDSTRAFNINVNRSISLKYPNESNFGFSVAIWRQNVETRLVVGSSKGVFSYNLSDFTAKNVESRLQLSDYNITNAQNDKVKLHEVNRVLVVAAGIKQDSPLLVCLPQSYYESERGTTVNQNSIGLCYLLNSTSKGRVRIQPKASNRSVLEKFHYCGFSASFSKDNSALFISCPAIIDEQSEVHALIYNLTTREVRQEDLTVKCPSNFLSGWGITSKDTKQMALTCGREGLVKETDDLSGFKALLKENPNAIGEMAGFSITSCDIDGDGHDEVFVGIPFGRVQQGTGWMETGKVMVKGKGEPQTILGKSEFSRFGSSITCLGDLNKDGCYDVAIGAPQHPGGGAVFIYLGSKQGLKDPASQVVYGSNITADMKGFGYSIAGLQDVDNNSFPDLLVGAPQSNRAIFLVTAPVIRLNVSSFHFNYDMIDLSKTNCIQNNSPKTCFMLHVELTNNSSEEVDVELSLQVSLDVGRPRKRVLFAGTQDSQHNTSLRDQKLQHSFMVYAEDLASLDDLAMSKAVLTISDLRVKSAFQGGLEPIFEDPDQPGLEWPNRQYETSVRLVCSSNITFCIVTTNIAITAEIHSVPFLVGAKDVQVNVSFSVENSTAFEPSLSLSKSQGLALKSAVISATHMGLDCQETTCSSLNKSCTSCAFPRKKMRPGNETIITLTFQQDRDSIINQTDRQSDPKFNVTIRASVFNEDMNPEDDSIDIEFLPLVHPDFNLIGVSVPETISTALNASFYTQHQINAIKMQNWTPLNSSISSRIGPTVKHLYNLTAKGDTPLKKIQLDLFWPIQHKINKTYISLLTELPKFLDPKEGTCNLTNEVEPSTLCQTFVCAAYRCFLQPSKKNEPVMLTIEAVIAASFFEKNMKNLKLESHVVGRVLKPLAWVLDEGKLLNQPVIRQQTTGTTISVKGGQTSTPPWVTPLSVIGGLALLAALTYGLYRVGFFKRKVIPKRTDGDGRSVDNETQEAQMDSDGRRVDEGMQDVQID